MSEWAPVVYARTLHDDTWWRAAPHDRAQDPWLKAQVRIVVAGGRELDRHPRFLLAHDGRSRFFGFACAAAPLSAAMSSTGGRPTYCFAGWVCEPRTSAIAIPSWEELTAHWTQWGASVYERWVAPDWSRSRSDRAVLPHSTEYAPDADLWPDARLDRDLDGAGRDELTPLSRAAHGTEVWPMSGASSLWAAAAASSERITAVLGVARADNRLLRGITHAAAFGLSRRQIVPGLPGPQRIP
jgi:hypothetical protein